MRQVVITAIGGPDKLEMREAPDPVPGHGEVRVRVVSEAGAMPAGGDARARLLACFSDVFPDVAAAKLPMATPTTVDSWDSIATATLVAVVEEEFGVSLDLSDPDALTSFDGFLEQLTSRDAAQTP